MAGKEAIQAIGYTDDGQIGILVNISLTADEARQIYEQAQQQGGITFGANLAMSPDYADGFIEGLKSASEGAKNVRNSKHIDQGGATLH